MNGIPLPPPLFKGAPCNMPVALPWPSPAVHHSIMHNCTSIYQHLPSASTHSRCCTREAALQAVSSGRVPGKSGRWSIAICIFPA